MSTDYKKKGCKDAVWQQSIPIKGKNPDLYRRDAAGTPIFYNSYGKNTSMGWEIDHRLPSSRGGSNSLSNLQSLQTTTNRRIQNHIVQDGYVKPNYLLQKQLYQNNPKYYEK